MIQRCLDEFNGCVSRYAATSWWGDLAGALDWMAELELLGYDAAQLDFRGVDVRKTVLHAEESCVR